MQNEEQGRSLKSEMSLESSERPVWIESREERDSLRSSVQERKFCKAGRVVRRTFYILI